MAARKYRLIKEGEKFNMLTLILKLKVKLVNMKPTYYGIYKCDCGNEKMILLHNVARGTTKSCGCLYAQSNKTNRKHIGARHKTN